MTFFAHIVDAYGSLAQQTLPSRAKKYICPVGRTSLQISVKVLWYCLEVLELTLKNLIEEAAVFSASESSYPNAELYGVTDGKAVGTYIEHKFRGRLAERYSFHAGNSAKGIDFPSLNLDIKVTSVRQPQSSSPFRSGRQKIFGLGYHLLVFVYDKLDDADQRAARLEILDTVFVEAQRTADFQTTTGLRRILSQDGNEDDLVSFMIERNLPLDEIEMTNIAAELLTSEPALGFLTISNALQWRLQYARVIEQAGEVDGLRLVHRRRN